MNNLAPEIKLFTAGDLADWLATGNSTAGLSTEVISRCRAAAIAHNPYVHRDDPCVAAIYINGKPVTFTATFADNINGTVYRWFSTLWCNPEHRGKGYPLIAVGTLIEHYGAEKCLDMWGAPETVEIFRYFGHNDTTVPEYQFAPKSIRRDSLKGQAAYLLNNLKRNFGGGRAKQHRTFNEPTYRLQYTNTVDEETYCFIQNHAGGDLIPRTREMLNWILAYPFMQRTPLLASKEGGNPFHDCDSRYWMSGVKLFVDDRLAAFYILVDSDRGLSVKYLYYDKEYADCVFDSVARHVQTLRNPRFTTRHPQLADYIDSMHLFDKKTIVPISFSYPPAFAFPATAMSQGGDGDGFV